MATSRRPAVIDSEVLKWILVLAERTVRDSRVADDDKALSWAVLESGWTAVRDAQEEPGE